MACLWRLMSRARQAPATDELIKFMSKAYFQVFSNVFIVFGITCEFIRTAKLMGECDCGAGFIIVYTLLAFLCLLLSIGGAFRLVTASDDRHKNFDTSFNTLILRVSVIAFVAAVLFMHLSLYYLFEILLPVIPYSRLAMALAFSFAISVGLNIICLGMVVNVFAL